MFMLVLFVKIAVYQLIVFSSQFEVALRVVANGANIGSLLSDYDMAAV